MSSKHIRLGIVGAGLWAERAHLPAFARIGGVKIVGIADPNTDRARELASRFGIPSVYDNHEDLLAGGVDAVTIAVPVDQHFQIASAALRRGVHVLCEKPLARTVDEAATLKEMAGSAGVVDCMGFMLRFSPAFLQLQELLESGAVGPIHSILYHSHFAQFFDPQTPCHWTMNAERTGGGVSVEYGCHGLDLARSLAGDITELCANARTLVPERPDVGGAMQKVDVDEVCSWLANFSGGAEGLFHVSWSSSLSFGVEFAVFGQKGALGWRKTESWPFCQVLSSIDPTREMQPIEIDRRYTDRVGWAESWRACFMSGLAHQFTAEIAGAPRRSPGFHDGLESQRALKAIGISLAERRWVSLDETSARSRADERKSGIL
ncbi:dehydrogenase (plasmid) [Mesorhizobium sp. 131-2-5]|uniref:Gfo/Idh/MocA family protein n=1 Tax=Mesorhizobium sp. 131-2-5 TaxID=2744519 RepID=UPI0018EAED8B|nr:Gfo/Idh/MocA family oxidoreductase [Mesorhizobium sp. 131-2-5]BCH04907.1 dehydrogenase [Mesorhizobium sp. 131-2-5]